MSGEGSIWWPALLVLRIVSIAAPHSICGRDHKTASPKHELLKAVATTRQALR